MKNKGSILAANIAREYYKKLKWIAKKELTKKHSEVEQRSAHQSHKLEVSGSNPLLATKSKEP